jgi:thiol-disulfide isomerase/thioredoxin
MAEEVSRRKHGPATGPTRAGARRRWLWWAGGLLATAVVVAAVVASQVGGAGGSDDGLALVAYQGEDVLGGRDVNFTDISKRGRPVVLNLWAGLCPPCRQEMPAFQRVYEDYKDELILVGVDVGPFVGLGSRADGQQLLRDLNITYPAAYAKSADIVREYQVLGMPTTVFFKPNGEIFRKVTGFMSEDALRGEVTALLDASGSTAP